MTQGSAILFSEMTPPPGEVDTFHRWYDEEHIPLRMAVPGFLSARRYQDTTVGAAGFLAVYEMATPDVLRSDAYGVVKNQPSDLTRRMLGAVTGFTRYIGTEISCCAKPDVAPADALDAPLLYAVWFNVPADRCAAFDEWYEEDHAPALMQSPDWLMIRRFAVSDGTPHPYTRLALHYLADVAAMTSPARELARATPWRGRIDAEPWFKVAYTVFGAHGPRQGGVKTR